MKLSAIVLSAMISFSAVGQNANPKQGEKPIKKTSTINKKKGDKGKKDSLETSSKNKKIISPDYCPPCGMG
jgi:hypothetical protein